MEPKESLELVLSKCEATTDEVVELAQFFHDIQEYLDAHIGADKGFYALRIILEAVLARSEGTNPDISKLADRLGVSRDTIRRINQKFKQDHPDMTGQTTEGTGVVYDYMPLSDASSQMIDHLVTLWRRR